MVAGPGRFGRQQKEINKATVSYETECLAYSPLRLIRVLLSLDSRLARASATTSPTGTRSDPGTARVTNVREALKSGLVGGLKLHGLGSVLVRLMLADSLYGRGLLSNSAPGLGHYFHLSKDTRKEKRGTRLESRLRQMSRLHADTKEFCGHKPG